MAPSNQPGSTLQSLLPSVLNDSLVFNDFMEQIQKEEEREPLRLSDLSLNASALNNALGENQARSKLLLKKSEVPLPLATDLKSFASMETRSLTTATDFIDTLAALQVPGPFDLFSDPEYIGRGAQFTVYKSHIPYAGEPAFYREAVAVKRSKFLVQSGCKLDLFSSDAKKGIHDMQLEILALCHAPLKQHSNIVQLLGWARDDGPANIPLLVLELALADLEKFLQGEVDVNTKHHLCLDIGSGLDALHRSGIIHGDLKPANVLVFKNDFPKVPFVAKLADFGFSVLEAQALGNDMIKITGYTPGWNAPEISCGGREISSADYGKADIYSFGLLIWSVFCFEGRVPRKGVDLIEFTSSLDDVRSRAEIPPLLSQTLYDALKSLLQPHTSDRPGLIDDLLYGNLTDQYSGVQAW